MNHKHIFIDVDGTLQDYETGIPDSAIRGIREARGNGHSVYICTGRARSDIAETIEAIGFDRYICLSGALVEVGGEVIFRKSIDGTQVDRLISLLKEKQIGFNLEGHDLCFLDDVAREIFIHGLPGVGPISPIIAQEFLNGTHIRPAITYQSHVDTISKLSLFTDSAALLKTLEENLEPGLRLLIHYPGPVGLVHGEIMLDSLSKATGIEVLMAHLGESLEDTYCFGDSLNDLEMVERCGVGISMGNGVQALKAAADHITDSVRDHGIYHGLLKHGLIQGGRGNHQECI